MAAAPHAVTSTPRRHLALVEPDARAGWGALRAELHARCADEDLAELWAGLKLAERKALAASAGLEAREALRGIADMPPAEREAIRAAIGRMSRYAQRLGQRLQGESPSRALAANARRALAEGDTASALHWLSLIEAEAQ